jgi:hypothetical protein
MTKNTTYAQMMSRGTAGQEARAVARRRAIVDANKARTGRTGKTDSKADKANMETDRGLRKHYSRMSKNDGTGRAADPNYARKWAKRKATGNWLKANKAASKGKSGGLFSRGTFSHYGGSSGRKLSGFAGATWGHKSTKPWWTKV